jgi:hypothetical protein
VINSIKSEWAVNREIKGALCNLQEKRKLKKKMKGILRNHPPF